MTESQKRKIHNLEFEIRKIEDKVDKLLQLRAMYFDQIKQINSKEPKVPKKPTDEERRAQAETDKKKFADKARKYSQIGIKRMDLGL